MGYAEHLTTAELGLGERSCFWQPGRHTHVPQGSLQPAPVLLLGTKKPFLLPGSQPFRASSLPAITPRAARGWASMKAPSPHSLMSPLAPHAASSGTGRVCAHFDSTQLLSTALWGGTDFSLLYLAAGTVSWCQVCVRGAAALGSAQGLAAKTSARGRFLPGEWSFSVQTEHPLQWLFRKR